MANQRLLPCMAFALAKAGEKRTKCLCAECRARRRHAYAVRCEALGYAYMGRVRRDRDGA